jgi:hypothetical protein
MDLGGLMDFQIH